MNHNENRPQFFLIDGHGLAYRAYFGMTKRGGRPLMTREGVPTGAVFAFTRIMLEIIRRYQPQMLAVSFDRPDLTFRHEVHDGYKAHRKPPPDDLIQQMPLIQDVIEAFGIPIYQKEGFEADDIIGGLAQQATAQGYDVRIVTGDRDLFQLVNDHVRLLMPAGSTKFDEFDPPAIFAKYGIHPAQVPDYKALAGDASDNIPGVAGIGDKTAVKLLQQYETLDKLYAALAEVPERYRLKLQKDRDMAYTSRHLATINPEVGLSLEVDRCLLSKPAEDRLQDILTRLEFGSMLRELPALMALFQDSTASAEAPDAAPSALFQPRYTMVKTLAQVETLAAELQTAPFALDTETTSLESLQADLVGLAFALPGPGGSLKATEAVCYYLPVGHRLDADQLPLDETLALLKPVLESPEYLKYGHNLKYDMNVLSRYGIHLDGICDDTMLIDYVLCPENKHGLKDLGLTCLNYTMQPITDLIGTGRKQITMAEVPAEKAAPYAASDVAVTQELRACLRPQVEQTERLMLYDQIETPLVGVLSRMEQNGIHLDTEFLATLAVTLDADLERVAAKIYTLAGLEFNLNSPKQLSEVLFEKMTISARGLRKTQSGGYSTDIQTLEKLRLVHPIADQLLEYRQLSKLKSTYIDALPLLVNPHTGRLHTTFNQSGTATGRLSSTNPNLQNIPIRTELGRQIRRAFVASEPGHVIVSFDYSQIELRLLAHFSEDPLFLKAFRSDWDIHTLTALEIFNLSEQRQVTPEMRRIAKTTNFGIVYGQTAYGLANTLRIPKNEAFRIIDRFRQRYAGIQAYMDQILKHARQSGRIETLFQRTRRVDDIHHTVLNLREVAERIAINTPLQGTAADLIKLAMVRIDRWLRTEKSPARMLLQVHDELVFEMPEAELEKALPVIRDLMENVYTLKVPLKVDINIGQNWMEAK